MKYYIYANDKQKAFIKEELNIDESFNDFIEKEQLEEYLELFFAYYQRSFYRDEKKHMLRQRNTPTHDIGGDNYEEESTCSRQPSTLIKSSLSSREETILRTKVSREITRIEENIRYMPINSKIETMLDLICHSNLDWMDRIQIKSSEQNGTQEIEKIQNTLNHSFRTKSLKKIKNLIPISIPSLPSAIQEEDY